MKTLLRAASCFLTAGLVVATIMHVVPQAVRGCELNPWKLMESTCHLNREKARSSDLSRRNEVVLRSLKAKSQIVAEYLDGRITLDEAADQFRAQSERSTQFDWDLFRRQFEGVNDHERFCRQVMSHATAALRENPDRQMQVQDELDKALTSGSEIIAHNP